jgi:hypothetical protein
MSDQLRLEDIPEECFLINKPTKEEQMRAHRIWTKLLGLVKSDSRKFPIQVNYDEPVYVFDSYYDDKGNRPISRYEPQSQKVITILQDKIKYEMQRNTGYVLKLNLDTKKLECDINPIFK